MSDAYARYRETSTFGSLDGLRAFSILAVIFFHSEPHLLGLFSDRGFLGVDLFFVISGFLIVTLLLREKEATSDISLKQFYIRRALRIFPAYYFMMIGLGTYFLFSATTVNSTEYFRCLIYNLLYVSNWVDQTGLLSILWSLATEEQFYLIWPALERYLPRRVLWMLILLFIIINQIVNFHLVDDWVEWLIGPNAFKLEIVQATFTPILLGVALAHVLHHRRTFAMMNRLMGDGKWSLGFVVAALLTLWLSPVERLNSWPRLTIQFSMALLVCGVVIRENHIFTRLLTFRPLAFIGKISYGLYLYHLIGRFVAEKLDAKIEGAYPPGAFLLVTFVATLMMAIPSYYLMERRFMKLRRRFTPKR